MNVKEAERLIEVQLPDDVGDEEKDNWGLWTHFSDKQQLLDQRDMTTRRPGKIDGVPIRGDPDKEEPQVLPASAEGYTPDRVLEDPPFAHVKELVGAEMKKRTTSRGTEQVILRDEFCYGLERVEYRFLLPEVEEVMHLNDYRRVLDAVKTTGWDQWDVELTGANELVISRTPQSGVEYHSQRVSYTMDEPMSTEMTAEEALEAIDVEAELARAAMELIGETPTRTFSETVHRHEGGEFQPDPPTMAEAAEAAQDFETVEDEVEIGEQAVSLGGLYMTAEMDG